MSFPPYPQDPNRNPNSQPGSDPYNTPSQYGQEPTTPVTPNYQGQGPTTPVPPVYQGQNPSTPFPPTAYDPYTQPSYPYPPPGPPPGSYVQPPPPPVTPSPGSPGRKWLLVALAAIVVLAGIGLAIFIPYQNTLTEQANATATASTNATHVAGTTSARNATAFVPTATHQAQATATASVVAANPDPYPPAGTLTMFDPLNTLSDKLPNSRNCTFSSGAYHVTQPDKGYLQPCTSGSSFSNFAFEVEMKITSGDCGGLLFRTDTMGSKYYVFEVCQNGTYDASIVQGNTSKSLLASSSAAINKSLNQSNVLAVVANGQHMDLYVNKQHITSFSDSSYSNGNIGLFADDYTNSTDAAFTNLKVWNI